MGVNERRNAVGEEAADWWLRLQSEGLSRADREQFVDWLRESPVHVAEMLRVAGVHGALEQFENWARISTHGSHEDDTVVALSGRSGDRPVRTPSSRRTWSIAAALSVVVVALVSIVWIPRGQLLETERGERRELALADGSLVYVDPESRLRVKFDEEARRVVLDDGRALFRVAKDSARPFLVEAGGTTVRAVGTAFGIERRPEGLIVTVAEGKVAVADANANVAARLAPPAGESPSISPVSVLEAPILLTANEQATVRSSDSFVQVRRVDSAIALAWAEGRLVFEDTPLAEVVEQFNRYNRIQVRIEDQHLASRPISGVFNAADTESFIGFIESTAPVRIERRAGDIIIAAAPMQPTLEP